MGREVKRVPMNFNWPMKELWNGYLLPEGLRSSKCERCDSTGYNSATKCIADDWYAFADGAKGWCHNITQDEVQALVDNGRLHDFTHRWDEARRKWVRWEDDRIPTADNVNEWSHQFLAHDAINRWICVETRARRLGVWGKCEVCGGDGELWRDAEHKAANEAWTSTEPPTGVGYQMWATTSEGSPISPVFETPEELALWLADNDASALGAETATYEQWLSMIHSEWAPSLAISQTHGVETGVAAIARHQEDAT